MHTAEFKARLALEAIRGVKTVQQIAADNELHPTQVTQWKTQMEEGAAGVFDAGRVRKTRAGPDVGHPIRVENQASPTPPSSAKNLSNASLCCWKAESVSSAILRDCSGLFASISFEMFESFSL
jgi:transposase-like protein